MWGTAPSDGRIGYCEICKQPVYNGTDFRAYPWNTKDGADFIHQSCIPADVITKEARNAEHDIKDPFADE